MPSEGHGRIFWIDIARALAIILIVGFHVGYEFTLDNGIRWTGFIGASLFFIISGFMLGKHDPDLTSFDLGWLGKRYLKIASLYYPTIIVLCLLFGSQIYDNGIRDIVAHFLFINATWPELTYSIISPAWFLIPLFFLYVFYPFINRLMKSHGSLMMILAVIVSMAARMALGGIVNPNPLFFLAEFVFGIAFAYGKKDAWMLAPIALALVMPVMAAPFIVFFALSLLPEAGPDHIGRSIASFIGQHTFEIFLFHESLMKAMLGKWKVFGLDALPSSAILIAGLLAVIAVSRWVNGIFSKKRSP